MHSAVSMNRRHQACHSWRRPGIQESPSVSFLAKTRNPAGSNEAASSNPFCWECSCHSWRRSGIQESPWIQVCHSRRRPGIQESPWIQACHSRRRPGIQESPWIQACHSWRRRGIQESPSVSFLAKTRNPEVHQQILWIPGQARNDTVIGIA